MPGDHREYDAAAEQDREFVSGEVACVLHLAPVSGVGKLATALAMTARPQLLAALEAGRLGVGQALAVLDEVEHLDAAHGEAVLEELFGLNDTDTGETPVTTPTRRST